MSSENNEFPIPFEESRRGRFSEQEEKASPGRLGKYLADRLVDKPNLREMRGRNGRNRGIDIDMPTGGKPGKRRPTGSRLDIDGDGWADEGTTNPVWVGVEGQVNKPSTAARFSSGMEQLSETERHNYGSLVASKKVKAANVKGKAGEYRIVISDSGTVAAFLESDIEKERNNLLDKFNDMGRNPFTDKEAPLTSRDIDDRDVLRGLVSSQRKIKPVAGMQTYPTKRGVEVFGIETREKHRRRGLATEMFNFHREVFPEQDLQHSDALSEDGKAFADATPTSPVSAKLSSGKGRDTKLNVTRYGKDDEYAQVSSFEIDGKTFELSRGGDSPGRNMYNGYISAFDGDNNVAYLDYNLDTANKKAVVAMVFTDEEYRGNGIAEALLDSFMTEAPDYEISPGTTTDDGGKWWRSVTGGDGPIRSEKLSSGKNEKKKNTIFPSGGREQGDTSERLSSGWDYEALVADNEKNSSVERSQLARKIAELLDNEELTRADEWETSIDAFGDEHYVPKPNEPRRALKEEITQGLTELFGGEIELRKDMVVTATNGEEINLGNKVKVVVYEARVDVDPLDGGTVKEVRELELYDDYSGWKDGAIFTQAGIWIHIVPTEEAAARLSAAGVPEDLTDPLALNGYDKVPVLGRAQRTINSMSGERQIVHDVFFISKQAQGYGIASQFNARNEKAYKDMGIVRILTEGSSFGEGWEGATHWPRNGFTWAGEKHKQEFIGLVDQAIKENILSDEERERISPLYTLNEESGLFETSASAEELIDFEKADSYFQEQEAGFLYKRDIEQSSERLSSGTTKQPSYPREPTLGAFLDGAEEKFSGVKTWEEFKERYNETEMVFLDYETTGLVFDEFGQATKNGNPTQIGLVRIKNGKEAGRLNLFMNPEEPLGEWSLKNLKDVDGNPISNEWLAQQMSMSEAHRQVAEFIGSEAIIGVQNATFDKNVLEDTLKANGIDWRPAGYLDTREISSLTLPVWSEDSPDGPFTVSKRDGTKKPSSSLAAITEYLGVELGDGHHNADADAFATSQVMQKIIDGAIEKGWSTIALDKDKRDSKLRKEREKFDAEVIQFGKDKEAFLAAQEEGQKLSSGASRIINGNENAEKANISFDVREEDLIDEDDSRFFDSEGNFDAEAYNEALDEKEDEIIKYLETLSSDVKKSSKLISEKNYPDKDEPQRFKEAKIQIEKAIPSRDQRRAGYLPPLVVARDADNNVVGIARFNKERGSIFIDHIGSYGQENNTPDLGASVFGKIVDIAAAEDMPIILESTPASEKYWRSLGFSDIDAEGRVLDGNKFLSMSKEDVRKLSEDSGRLSSGAKLSEAFEEPIETTQAEAAAMGSTRERLAGEIAAKRIIDTLQKQQGKELSELQQRTIENIVPGLLVEIQGKTLLDIELDGAFSETGKDLLNSISVDISSDGIPFVSADPIPQLSEQIPDKRDWRNIEIPKSDDVTAILEEAMSDTVTSKGNVWLDSDGNIIARKVYKDDAPVLEYENEEARQRFPLLEIVAPKGYVLSSDSIGLGSLNQGTLPGKYEEAWKKHGLFLRELARRSGEAMGDEGLFLPSSRKNYTTSTYLRGYIGGLTDPSKFNMGINGKAEQYHHDLFGHIGTGRGFDRHGEWANDLAMMSMVDHPDSPLTSEEKIAVQQLHYLLYGANRMFRVGRLDEEQKNSKLSETARNSARDTFDILPVDIGATTRETRVYAGDFSKVIEKLTKASETNRLSSGKSIYDADERDVELAIANDALGVLAAREDSDSDRLSSGSVRRPLIPMRTREESDRPSIAMSRTYKYGEDGPNGRPIRKTTNDWLKGLSNKQIANVLVPESEEQMFEMFVDDFAPALLSSKDKKGKKAFKKYWDDMWQAHPYHRPDFSPESRKAITEALESSLDSNPALRWAFQKHGAPNFYVMTPEAMKLYHEIPSIKQILELSKQRRGTSYDLEVRGISSSLIDGVFINPKALINRDKNGPQFEDLQLLTVSTSGSITSASNHIDDSVQGVFTHEWGHWLHYRALRDLEYAGKRKNRTYYLSGDMADDKYFAGLEVAQKYKLDSSGKDVSGPDAQLIEAHTNNLPFDSGETIPRTSTGYAHTNMREMLTEGVVAVLHPDKEVQQKHMNSILRDDVHTLLGISEGESPWESSRLSSGAEDSESEPKTGRFRKLVQKLRGDDDDEQEKPSKPKKRPTVEPYEPKTQNLRYFQAPVSKALIEMDGTVPTESVLSATTTEDVTHLPEIPGVAVRESIFTTKASIKAKNMIATNVADSVDIAPERFIELFKGLVPDYGTPNDSLKPFFGHGSNFGEVAEILERVRTGGSGLFLYQGDGGRILKPDEMLERLRRYKKYQDEVISKLADFDFDELVNNPQALVDRLNEKDGIIFNLYSLSVVDRVGGKDVQEELIKPMLTVAENISTTIDSLKKNPEQLAIGVRRYEDGSYSITMLDGIDKKSPINAFKDKLLQSNLYGLEDVKKWEQDGDLITITAQDVDSPESIALLKDFYLQRMSAYSGMTADGKSARVMTDIERQGKSIFDASTEEGMKQLKNALVSDFIHTWAISANDSNPVGLAIQNVAREMFGLEEAVGWKPGLERKVTGSADIVREIPGAVSISEKVPGMPSHEFDGAPNLVGEQREVVKQIMQAIYDATQMYYSERGITHVPVWRGMVYPDPSQAPKPGEAVAQKVTMRPLSSWTYSPTMANNFSYAYKTKGEAGAVVMKGYVPVSDVFSTALTGFGCLSEDELVLLGRNIDVVAMGGDEMSPETAVNGEYPGLSKIMTFADMPMDEFNDTLDEMRGGRLSSGKVKTSEAPKWKQVTDLIDWEATGISVDDDADLFDKEEGFKEVISSDWQQWDPCREIRTAGYELAGIDDYQERDPNIDREGGFFGNSLVRVTADQRKRVEEARYVMASIVDSMINEPKYDRKPYLYRAMPFNSPEEGKAFFDAMKPGNLVDIPMLAFTDMGPVAGNHFLTRFGDDVLIVLEDFPGSYSTGGYFEPLYNATSESDTLYNLDELASEILAEIEDGVYEDDVDLIENSKQFAEQLSSLVEEYKSIGRSDDVRRRRIRLDIEEMMQDSGREDFELKWDGVEMPDTDEDYYSAIEDEDSGMVPREYISGGRLEVKEVKEDSTGLYKQIVVLRQTGAFDPQEKGSLIVKPEDGPNRPRLSSGKQAPKKAKPKSVQLHDDEFKKKFDQEVPDGDGNCFSEAVIQARKLANAYDRVKIVHGYPLGTGGEAEGLRYPHAWVEFTENGVEWVRDYSNGNKFEFPKALYYGIGNIDEKDARKYDIEEATKLMDESQHYGPW